MKTINKQQLKEFIDSIPNARFQIKIKQQNGDNFDFETNELGVRMLQVEHAKNKFNSIIQITDVLSGEITYLKNNGTFIQSLESMSLCINQKIELLRMLNHEDMVKVLGED